MGRGKLQWCHPSSFNASLYLEDPCGSWRRKNKMTKLPASRNPCIPDRSSDWPQGSFKLEVIKVRLMMPCSTAASSTYCSPGLTLQTFIIIKNTMNVCELGITRNIEICPYLSVRNSAIFRLTDQTQLTLMAPIIEGVCERIGTKLVAMMVAGFIGSSGTRLKWMGAEFSQHTPPPHVD